MTAGRAGELALRPETAEDAIFLSELFAAGARAVLAAAALPEAMVAQLVEHQHRAQRQTYAALYPAARRWILLWDGAAVGRLMEADTAGGRHIVDIAVVPERQREGVATATVARLMDEATRAGGGVTAEVALGNVASRALFRRLGFAETAPPGAAHFQMAWGGPAALPPASSLSPAAC